MASLRASLLALLLLPGALCMSRLAPKTPGIHLDPPSGDSFWSHHFDNVPIPASVPSNGMSWDVGKAVCEGAWGGTSLYSACSRHANNVDYLIGQCTMPNGDNRFFRFACPNCSNWYSPSRSATVPAFQHAFCRH